MDEEFDRLADEGATEEQIMKAKQEHSRLEVLLGEDATIDALVKDIIKHYEENRAQELTGKAMIVALDPRHRHQDLPQDAGASPRVDGEGEGGDEQLESGPRRLAADYRQRSLTRKNWHASSRTTTTP